LGGLRFAALLGLIFLVFFIFFVDFVFRLIFRNFIILPLREFIPFSLDDFTDDIVFTGLIKIPPGLDFIDQFFFLLLDLLIVVTCMGDCKLSFLREWESGGVGCEHSFEFLQVVSLVEETDPEGIVVLGVEFKVRVGFLFPNLALNVVGVIDKTVRFFIYLVLFPPLQFILPNLIQRSRHFHFHFYQF
jgi:hypothetical protein